MDTAPSVPSIAILVLPIPVDKVLLSLDDKRYCALSADWQSLSGKQLNLQVGEQRLNRAVSIAGFR